MKRQEYDLAFGMGGACCCSQALRTAGLQFASYPFDWVARVDLRGRTQIVADDFANWLIADQMWFESGTRSYDTDIYHNRVTGIGFNHDFPRGVPLKDSFAHVQEKYRRRIARLYETIRASRRVLIVWIGYPEGGAVPDDQIAFCLSTFRRKFPGVEFHMFVAECLPEIPAAVPRRTEGDGFTRVSFDYEDRSHKGNRFQVRFDLLRRELSRFSVKDPRTAAEKAEYRRVCAARRKRRYAAVGAQTAIGYAVRKQLQKLKRHFEKRRPYDGVVSLGQWCATAMALKKLGLRSASGPFDWLGAGRPIQEYVGLLTTAFDGFLQKGNLEKVGEDKASGRVYYMDRGTSFEFRHDFDAGHPLDEAYARVRAKYDRRIARLLTALRGGGRFLLVHYRGSGRYADAELVEAMTALRAHFPAATLDLLVLETDATLKGLFSYSPAPGIVRTFGDFYDLARFNPVMGNEPLLLSALREIRLRGRWRNLLRMRVESFRRRLFRRFGRRA